MSPRTHRYEMPLLPPRRHASHRHPRTGRRQHHTSSSQVQQLRQALQAQAAQVAGTLTTHHLLQAPGAGDVVGMHVRVHRGHQRIDGLDQRRLFQPLDQRLNRRLRLESQVLPLLRQDRDRHLIGSHGLTPFACLSFSKDPTERIFCPSVISRAEITLTGCASLSSKQRLTDRKSVV